MTFLSLLARASRAIWGGATPRGTYDLNNDGHKDLFVTGGHVLDNARKTRAASRGSPIWCSETRAMVHLLPNPWPARPFIGARLSAISIARCCWKKVSPTAVHWIGLHLVGTRSHRDCIGAIVHIATAYEAQWNRATTAVGYASSTDRIVHFGLGRALMIQSIEIAWSSGIQQHLSNVPADGI